MANREIYYDVIIDGIHIRVGDEISEADTDGVTRHLRYHAYSGSEEIIWYSQEILGQAVRFHDITTQSDESAGTTPPTVRGGASARTPRSSSGSTASSASGGNPVRAGGGGGNRGASATPTAPAAVTSTRSASAPMTTGGTSPDALGGIEEEIGISAAAANASSLSTGVVDDGRGEQRQENAQPEGTAASSTAGSSQTTAAGVSPSGPDNTATRVTSTAGDNGASPSGISDNSTVGAGVINQENSDVLNQLTSIVEVLNRQAAVSENMLKALDGDKDSKTKTPEKRESDAEASASKLGKLLIGYLTGAQMIQSIRNAMDEGRDPTVDNFVRDKRRNVVTSGLSQGATGVATGIMAGAPLGPWGMAAGAAAGIGSGIWSAVNTGWRMDIERQQDEKQGAYNLDWMMRNIGYETNLDTSRQFMRMGMQFDSVQGRQKKLRSRAERLRYGIYGEDDRGEALDEFNTERKTLAGMFDKSISMLNDIGGGWGDKDSVLKRLEKSGKYTKEEIETFDKYYAHATAQKGFFKSDNKERESNDKRLTELSGMASRKEDFTVRELSDSLSAETLGEFSINSPQASILKQVVSEDKWKVLEARAARNGGVVKNDTKAVANIQEDIIKDWNDGGRKDDAEKLGIRLRLTAGSKSQDRQKMEARKNEMESEAAQLEREAQITGWKAKLDTMQMPDTHRLVDAYQSKGMNMGTTINAGNVEQQMYSEMQKIRQKLEDLQKDYEKRGDNYDIKANNVTVNQVAA